MSKQINKQIIKPKAPAPLVFTARLMPPVCPRMRLIAGALKCGVWRYTFNACCVQLIWSKWIDLATRQRCYGFFEFQIGYE